MPRYEVVGPRKISGVEKGGYVDLDPSVYNIAALIRAGHIVEVKKTKKAEKTSEDKEDAV